MTLSRSARAFAFVLPILAAPAAAHDGMVHEGCPPNQTFEIGDLTISGGFTRETLPDANVGAGYLTVENRGGAPDRLVGVASAVAPTTEIHNMTTENGMMKMSEVEGGVEIPAGGSISLTPGGMHLMFIGLSQMFIEGECVEVTLRFETAGELAVQLAVGAVGASAADVHEGH